MSSQSQLDFSTKRVLVTDGSRGIGQATAIEFAQRVADVAITYAKSKDRARSVVQKIQEMGRSSACFYFDAGSETGPEDLAARFFDSFGHIDVLVSNAGVFHVGAIVETSAERAREIMSINFTSPARLIEIFGRQMIVRKAPASIVCISSVVWDHPRRNVVHYAASKAALTTFARGAAAEFAQYGVRVNVIAPGLIETDMNRNIREKDAQNWTHQVSRIPLGRAGEPKDIVGTILLLASSDAAWITGSCVVVDGGRTIE